MIHTKHNSTTHQINCHSRVLRVRLLFVVGIGSLLLLLIVPCGALAGQRRLYAGTFGDATSTRPNPYPLEENTSVAADESSGDVYVVDDGHRRVEKFTATGEFLLMFGEGVNKTAIEQTGRASEANVCPAPGHPTDICQSGVDSSSPGAFYGDFDANLFLAVDNSSDASSGDVYVSDDEDGLVSKFDSSGKLVESWGNNGPGGSPNGQLNGSTSHSFVTIAGVAVDSSGDLWVDKSTSEAPKTQGESLVSVFRFTENAATLTEWPNNWSNGILLEKAVTSSGIALDSKDDLFTSAGFKFAATGAYLGRVFEGWGDSGLAIDSSTNELYLDATAENKFAGVHVVDRFSASCTQSPTENSVHCTPAEEIGAGLFQGTSGLAIDPAISLDSLYVAEGNGQVAMFARETVPDVVTSRVSGLASGNATLNGTVDADGVALNECFFEWGKMSEPYTHKATCEPEAGSIQADSNVHAVKAEISGLANGVSYRFRLVAANANDVNGSIDEPITGEEVQFGPPLIQSASALATTSTTATLQAQADPNDADTKVHLEYGGQAGVYNQSSPVVDLGSASSYQSTVIQLEGLSPNTPYHYRLVAESILGTAVSGDEVFITQSPGAFSLLDGRAWELVSPPNKQGSDLEPIGEQGVIQASSDGSALTYNANGPIEPQPAGNALLNQVLAVRGAAGWSSRDIAIPHGEQSGISLGAGNEYRFFSEDLSRGIVQPFGPSFVPLSGEATGQTAYLRNDFVAGHESEPCSGSCYTPLVSAANVPAGTEFGPWKTNGEACSPNAKICGPMFVDANPDGTAVVLKSFTPLVEGAPHGGLYEWSDDALRPVSAGGEVGGLSDGLGITKSARGAVSADGSRVVTSDGNESHLYSTDMETGEALLLDKVQGGTGAGRVSSVFQLASADGSRVFFTDEQRLTAGAGANEGLFGGPGTPDLYECAIVEQGGEPVCELSDLTPRRGSKSADVEGSVIGASESGESVYFVANGVLGSNSNDQSETAAPGSCLKYSYGIIEVSATCNLYVYRDGVTTFIARLSEADSPDWSTDLSHLTARVSPNGEWLAFMSERSLTGYDNRDASTGQPDEEVFLYHEGRGAGEAGSLVCASCNPTGARPHGAKYAYDENLVLAGGDRIWLAGKDNEAENPGLAANIPGWTPYASGVALYQSRYLSDSGRLFFNSPDDLAPQDTNGTEDVYEYEPPESEVGAAASDTCTAASSSYSAASKGCIDLISSGTSPEESAFLDASESGDDVFFLTAAQLSPRDPDTSLDVYDARADGAEPPVVRPVECQGDACQAFVAPPEELTPGSLIHSGPGNPAPAALSSKVAQKTKPLTRAQKLARALRACAKQKRHKRRAACERQARRAYGSKKPAGGSQKPAGKSSRRGGR
ncbi:MAG: hypothetical protein WBV85_11485 [Solirubrobacteraceae bacterium]